MRAECNSTLPIYVQAIEGPFVCWFHDVLTASLRRWLLLTNYIRHHFITDLETRCELSMMVAGSS